ncbi:HDOD domain-containing protein [Janthinobacterium fluminis]|uniref:HDOD domain-containing protein n=1 Tax=Janthinobacterium fluminis TaxID=2987524 RepID=A0ABT5JX39_9BURK|nr:HDOD domain-containing protein [Janthinobacterium fluminis]MDC8756102.1 HDOD domain-containing protein [Janthinobacterium fluminis]
MSSLVFFHLLANRQGAPAALLLAQDETAGAACAGAAGLDGEAMRTLGAQLACFYPERLGPAPLLQAQGWRPLDEAGVLRGAAPFGPLPAGVAWRAGDWYLAPPAKAADQRAASRTLALQLVQLLARDADTHEIEALLRHDPSLSYHLLRLVNSQGIGNGRRVSSFSQAILILGRQQLRRWLNLMLYAARPDDVRAAMLLARVAVRAHALALLARAAGMDRLAQEQAFMCGMFSLLGVLFGLPLAELLQPLQVDEAVQGALLAQRGELGALLALLLAAERGDFAALARQLQGQGLAPAEFNGIVLDAYLWMLGVLDNGA